MKAYPFYIKLVSFDEEARGLTIGMLQPIGEPEGTIGKRKEVKFYLTYLVQDDVVKLPSRFGKCPRFLDGVVRAKHQDHKALAVWCYALMVREDADEMKLKEISTFMSKAKAEKAKAKAKVKEEPQQQEIEL